MNYRINIFIISLIIAFNTFTASVNAQELPKVAIKRTTVFKQSTAPKSLINFDQLDQTQTAHFLGWMKDSGKCKSFCGGHYFESVNLTNVPIPQSFNDSPMSITASKPAFFVQHGASVIEGDVVLIQPGREITADHMIFYRYQQTGRIGKSILSGHVNFREYNKLVVAAKGNLDFINKRYIFDRGVYRILANTSTGLANAWGRTKRAVSTIPGVMKFNLATYNTCPPDDPVWNLWGTHLTLNRNTGRGEAVNAFVFLGKLPIFYTPYFSFPIDKKRKSGFLMPSPTYSKSSGYSINLPYYFNLAPNYDAMFTPEFFTERGILLSGIFRYLTPTSQGNLNLNYIYRDRVFMDFRNQAQFGTAPLNAVKGLKESSANRGFGSLKHVSRFNEHWRGLLDVNHITDDYFLKDFDDIFSPIDQLLNKAEVGYAGDYWAFLGGVQFFQTLHRINQSAVKDQYQRLPQINLSGNFPSGLGGMDYRLDSEVVNFTHQDDFYTDKPVISGARFNVTPSVSRMFNWLGGEGYIVPKVQLQTTGYSLYNQQAKGPHNIVRFYPIISVDNGAIFGREISFFNEEYTQTLEPKLFYLLVPVGSKGDVPLFDTYLPAFDFNQLFRTNRFSGVDRVSEANQVSLAVTTKLLDDFGQEKLSASIGQIVAFRKHQVTIVDNTSSSDPLLNVVFSPLVGQLKYSINSKTSTSFNMAWDHNHRRLNTASVSIRYANDVNRFINLWYNYALLGDQLLQGEKVDLNRLGLSFGWKILQHWNLIGSFNYSASSKMMQNYLYGFEYNSCCWALRIVERRDFVGVANSQKKYDYRFYVQFLFKGLGSMGSRSLGELLKGQISGYQDQLATGY